MANVPRIEPEPTLGSNNSKLPDMASERTEERDERDVKGKEAQEGDLDDERDDDSDWSEEEDDEEDDVKELRMQNYLLRKENEELQKQLEALMLKSSGETETVKAESPPKLSSVGLGCSEEGRKPEKNCDGVECAKNQCTEKRKGKLEQGKKSFGESCSGAEKVKNAF